MKNPIQPTWKTEALPLLCILTSFIASFYFYAHFPAQVPIHWNFAGQVDRWGSAAFGAFFLPFLILGVYLLFLFLPYLDPKHKSYEEFKNFYHIFKGILIGFLTIIYFSVSLDGMGYNIPIKTVVTLGVGVIFLVLGNYLGKIKSNWFIGIRTPWTLSSEKVWDKTHQIAGKTFMIAGVLFWIIPYLPGQLEMEIFIAIIALLVLIPVVYSFFVFKQEEKKK